MLSLGTIMKRVDDQHLARIALMAEASGRRVKIDLDLAEWMEGGSRGMTMEDARN